MTINPLIIVLIVLVLIPALIALSIVIFRWLWNITMPQVFGLRPVTFWQAFRVLLIASILFGNVSFAQVNNTNQKLTALESHLNTVVQRLDIVSDRLAQRP
jgi:hypothetical protein